MSGAVRPAVRCSSELLGEGLVTHLDVHAAQQRVLFAHGVGPQTVLAIVDYSRRLSLLKRTFKDVCSVIIVDRVPALTPSARLTPSMVFRSERVLSSLPAYLSPATPDAAAIPVPSSATAASYGSIRSMHIADYSHLLRKWNKKPTAQIPFNSLHSESLLMLLCDQAVLFHDWKGNFTRVISCADMESKASPTCAEFIHEDVLAIGCSDGVIRLWSVSKWTFMKSLTAHAKKSKSELFCVRSLPDDKHTSKIGYEVEENCMRFISTSKDCTSYMWLGSVADGGGIVDLTEPIATLVQVKKDRMFATTSQPVEHYYDAAKAKLYCTASTFKTRVYDLSMLPTLAKSRPNSSKSSKSHTSVVVTMRPAVKRKSSISHLLPNTLMTSTFRASRAQESVDDNLIQIPCITLVPKVVSSSVGKVSGCSLLRNPFLYPGNYGFVFSNRTDALHVAVAYSTRPKGTDKLSSSVRSDEPPSETASNHSAGSSVDAPSTNTKALHLIETFLVRIPSLTKSGEEISGSYRDVKVMSVIVHPLYQDQLILSTSIGVVLLRIKHVVPHGSHTTGVHSMWGSTHLTYRLSSRTVYQHMGQGSDEDLEDDGNAGSSSDPDSKETLAYSISSEYVCPSGTLGFVTSVPMFYPSPSGNYCIVHWPNSIIYVILRLASSLPGSNKELVEVDRGTCIAIGWIGGGPDDAYALITPTQRLIQAKKKSILPFHRKEEDDVTEVPQQLLFFLIEPNSTAASVFNVFADSAIHGGWAPYSLRGGSLLCMSLTKEEVSKANKSSMKFMSQFFRLALNVSAKADSKLKTKKRVTAEAAADETNKPKYRLESVDQPFREVTDAAWNYKKDSSWCGVTIDGRLSVAMYGTSAESSQGDLIPLRSVEVSGSSPSPSLYVSFKLAEVLQVQDLSGALSVSVSAESARIEGRSEGIVI